jgi:Mn2+/Fe2+ NRAMP family transporter
MMLIINKQEIMGDYRNSRIQNTIAVCTTIVLVFLSALLFIMPVLKAVLKK